MAKNWMDSVPNSQTGNEAPEAKTLMDGQAVKDYCRELEKQGIEYVIIPIGQLKKHACPGDSD